MEALSREELLRLLAAAKAKAERDWILILVTYWHGLRASEAVNLTRANFPDGYLSIQRLKGSKKTTQPLMTHSNPLLDERLALRKFLAESTTPPGDRLFKLSRFQFYRLVRFHGSKAEIPAHKLHPHVLKHSIAMSMIREAGIENTRQYLGHKSGASTMEYLKSSDEEASAAIMRAEEKRVDNSETDRLDNLERVTVAESLRRALRMVEQSGSKSVRKARARTL